MSGWEIFLGILILIVSVIAIVAVGFQSSRNSRLGAITGEAESFFGKGKGSSMDKILGRVTIICLVAIVVLSIILNLILTLS